MMTQVRPYDHINIRQEFIALANQALVDAPRPERFASANRPHLHDKHQTEP
jgi:hypothetical protein